MFRFIAYWLLRWLYFWTILLFIGGVLGGLVYLTLGQFFKPQDWSQGYLASKGITNGMKWLGVVWGTGGAIVLCFIDAHRKNQRKRSGEVAVKEDAVA